MLKVKAMKWVKALRSGKYKQATQALKKFDKTSKVFGYCCLGVLGEISGLYEETLQFSQVLPYTNMCGLRSQNGVPYHKGLNHIRIKVRGKAINFADLTNANDGGATFKQIANWIEKNYKVL